MTKIDIISGFLGAGKTTLIKKLLEEVFQDEKVVLVENEYGEVGIDGGFLKDAGIEIKELNSGCICCTLVGDFSRSLRDVMERFTPDRILIEPSGVGKLSDVMTSVKEMEENFDVKLNALVTVVNAKKAVKQLRAFGEFFGNQIENATTIVLSRTQEMEQEPLDVCVAEIRERNPKAAIVTTPWDQISAQQMLDVVESQRSFMEEMMAEFEAEHHHHEHEHHHDHDHDHEHEHHHDHDHDHEHEHHHDHDHDHDHEHHHHHDHDHEGHHHADEIFTSWGIETPHKYTKEGIEEILKNFIDSEEYGEVLRAKGMVPAEDGTWIYFDMVPGDYEIREGAPEYTGRLCVIGTELDEAGLAKLFNV